MEFDWIKRLQQQNTPAEMLKIGIGDDCAVLQPTADWDTIVTTDTLLDGVHFLSVEHSATQIARKAIAVSLSDIAAMAGLPRSLFLNLAIPRSWNSTIVEQLCDALAAAAAEFQIPIAGGDTTTWNGPLALTTTIWGEVEQSRSVLRSGAQPGDIICVSGPLGGSILQKQFTFTPRIREARWLAANAEIHAMCDISDGLLADLQHILLASGVGAEIDAAAIPIAADARKMIDEKSPLEHALSDGEDFELLWTMPARSLDALKQWDETPLKIYPVGKIVAGNKCCLLDQYGQPIPCNVSGYVHHLNKN